MTTTNRLRHLITKMRGWLKGKTVPPTATPVQVFNIPEPVFGKRRHVKRTRPCKHFRHLSSGNGMNRWPAKNRCLGH